MIMKFSERSMEMVVRAYQAAYRADLDYIGTEHILFGMFSEGENISHDLLKQHNISPDMLTDALSQVSGKAMDGNKQVEANLDFNKVVDKFTPRTKRLLEIAALAARNSGRDAIEPEHFLMAIIREGDNIALKILLAAGINPRDLYKEIRQAMGSPDAEAGDSQIPGGGIFGLGQMSSQDAESKGADTGQGGGAFAKSSEKGKSKTPTLDKYGIDLTDAAVKGEFDPIIGREKEIERVMQILCRRTKNNPCLIGEPGVGKTAISEGLAQKIVSGDIPEMLKNKRLVALDMSGMIAGAKYRGEFEERFKNSLNEAMEADDTILFIDELHTVIGAGSAEGSMDAANILKPLLTKGKLQIIGATTTDEYRKHIEKDSAFERRFQPVTVDEPSEDEAAQILKGIKSKYEAHHNVRIPDEVIDEAVKLSLRYLTDRFLPDKAIDLIDEAASRKRMKSFTMPESFKEYEEELEKIEELKKEAADKEDFESAAKYRSQELEIGKEFDQAKEKWKLEQDTMGNILVVEDIAKIVSDWSGVPVQKLTEEDSDKLKNLDLELKKRVIGQDEAVMALVRAIRRGRLGLKDPKRPSGSFVFLGTTGVGKTELAKALSELLFGSEDAMIRLDMSEYMEKFDVSKLIGSPPGYVGYDEGGQLTEKVRRRPYSVVLFDEVEKAHPDVLNALLQILEDGRLTDSQGRTVDFRNTVLIMTSNIGARLLTGGHGRKIGFDLPASSGAEKDKEIIEDDKGLYGGRDYQEAKDMIMEELKKAFSPEFINRIDELIFFRMLSAKSLEKIVDLMLADLIERIADLKIELDFTDEVKARLAEEGYDPSYGARPLRRVIQSNVEDNLAQAMIDGLIKEGDRALFYLEDGKIAIKKNGK